MLTLAEAYRTQRREGYSASVALAIARHKLTTPEFDWDAPRGITAPYGANLTRDGFDITVRVNYEDCPDLTVTWANDEWELPDRHRSVYRNPNGRLQPADFGDGGGWVWKGYDHRYAYCVPQGTVVELADFYHDHDGLSRSVALDRAREIVRSVVELYTGEHYTEYVITVTAYKKGVELGSDVLGGVGISDESPYPTYAHVQFEQAIADHDMIGTAVVEAQTTLEELCA
ncbi:MAG: hypothetical protein ACJ780_10255 [Solirubrobacteraceae bacterium]|jgi:hypothetical protein